MSFRVIFRAEAEAELNDAIVWYNLQTDGAGRRFSAEIREIISEAAKNPIRFGFAGPTTQKIKVLNWPYAIYFTLVKESSLFIVVSIFHGSRNPADLRRRLK